MTTEPCAERVAPYDQGFATGRRFMEMEQRGWDPGNTYLASMVIHKDEPEWIRGFEAGLESPVQHNDGDA